MSKLLGNDSSGLQGLPGLTKYDNIAGSETTTLRQEFKWNRRRIWFVSLFLIGLYLPILYATLSSGVTIIMILGIATPILLGVFIGLLYWFNRNYG